MKTTIRQQVKENFQSMDFSKAMEVNNELKSEYIEVCGQRSWVSLVNYYSKKAAKEQPKVEEKPEETVAEQPEVQEQPVAEVKELSPVMKQYRDLKEQHPDAVLLFRIGDFYEAYEEDAETAADILGIVITTRNTDGTKMAGFPHHALDTYLPKLVRAGKRIAICDQLEDPKLAKKLVKRGITELVTPGMAEEKQAEATIDEEASQEQTETITSEEVGTIEDIITTSEEPAKEETYKFNFDTLFAHEVKNLVESGQPILNQFCIIHEFFKRVSDTETQRYTKMFVKADGEGWKLYDEGSAAAKAAGIKSYRKLGYFDQSNDGFPVGEEYSQVTVMRIKKALEKFVLGRTGVTAVENAIAI